MPMCKDCGNVVGASEIVDGYCSSCLTSERKENRDEKDIRENNLRLDDSILDTIMVTTETFIDLPIEKRLNLVFSQYVYGMNIVKDFFTSIRDIVGGRVENIEKSIKITNEEIIKDIKSQAYMMGGNAVIGLRIDYNATIGMLSVVAVGTVVKLKT